jgi:hypothetical protein
LEDYKVNSFIADFDIFRENFAPKFEGIKLDLSLKDNFIIVSKTKDKGYGATYIASCIRSIFL